MEFTGGILGVALLERGREKGENRKWRLPQVGVLRAWASSA